MNIPYLLKILDTTKFSDLIGVIDATPLDMNLALWDSIDAGEIQVIEEKNKIKLLVEPEPWHDPELTNKLLRTIQHYAKNDTNITRGRMNSTIKEPITNMGYPTHEYIMSIQYLIDTGQVVEEVIEVPKSAKRPYHKFVFLCLPENGEKNPEWNARVVNKWIDDFAKSKVK